MLCGCPSPVGGRACSLVVGVEAPRSVSELQSKVGGIGVRPLREEPLSISPLELSTSSVLCGVTCHLLCWLTKYTVVGTALGPTSTVGMPAISPGVTQALFS